MAAQTSRSTAESGPSRRRAPPTPADPTAFYPTNCAHGPQKRAIAPQVSREQGAPMNMDPSFDSDPEPLPDMVEHNREPARNLPQPDAHAAVIDEQQAGHDPVASSRPTATVNVAAQLMSAELLVDLATSTLAAAGRLKELYVAQQMQRPARGSTNSSPPTDADIANAKMKVREAAGVMYDLAA